MLSVVIPFYNEKESLSVLVPEIINQFKKIKTDYEVILVNDGSNDGFNPKIFSGEKNIKVINFRKRLGKGPALRTGLKNSQGDKIIFMDADLQDDPKDLPRLIKKLDEGYDFVNGVRQERKEYFLVKSYSKLATGFLKKFLHSPYSDVNCGFKIFKKEVLTEFIFYGNNFRFFPIAAFLDGYKVTEIPVANNKRIFGKTKFGQSKVFVGILDTLTAFFLFKFSEEPLHFFGMIGGALFFIGFLISIYLTYLRIFNHVMLYRRPLLEFGGLLIVVGIQIIMTGIIGELIVFTNKKK